MFINNYAQ